jgi:flagellar basal body P-ring formation protein FlgA
MWRALMLLAMAGPAAADTLVPTRTIRAQALIGPDDVVIVAAPVPGALTHPDQAVGQEARVALYPGRPIRPGDLGPPALVDRNATVMLTYAAGGLTITAEGRALARAAAGEEVRVMNLASRSIVHGRVTADGRVTVGPTP